MAYQGGYDGGGGGGPQRPYAPHSAPRGYNDRPPPRRPGAQQPHDDYHVAYGHEGQGTRHQDYDLPLAPPPPHDYYGAGPAGSGGPVARPATAEGHRRGQPPPRGRGMGPGPGPSRGMPGPGNGPYPPNPDRGGARRPPMGNGPPDHRDPGYGMGYAGQGDYGRHPPNASNGHQPRDYPPHAYSNPSQGPPPGQAFGGYGGPDDDYGYVPGGNSRDGFGPPGRSMTMPTQDSGPRHHPPPPQRSDTLPYSGPAVPPRPSTANGGRPLPQRMHAPNPQGPSRGQYGGGYNDSHGGHRHEPTLSADDVFNSYFDDPEYGSHAQPSLPGVADLDSAPSQRGRGDSFEQPQRGPHQMPRLHHARSEANVREPQAAVFEMAGDIPSVPPMPHGRPWQHGFAEGYGGPGAQDPMPPPPRGPNAPPGPSNAPRPGGMSRTAQGSPDALPSHPMPGRPAPMGNPMVSPNDRPPPVRNYGTVLQAGPMQPQPAQQQQRMAMRAGQQAPEIGPLEQPVTPQELERLRMAIKTNPNDHESALRLAKKLMEAADVLAPKVPDAKQRGRIRERYLMDAHKILKKLANAQNQESMFILADGLGKGLFGHEPDTKEAFTLYQSAAKLGHAAAAYRTAVCCEIGHEEGGGTRKDPLKAMQWYKRAATLGDTPAMYKVGMIQLKGLLGQPKNPKEAVGWLKRAAERADAENPHALHELGLLYESAQPSDAILRDERYALSLFQQAADLGYKFSQFRLGCAFECGALGCPVDPRQSIYWYSQAATQQEHQSELALSGWYLTGSDGVLGQSDTEAYLWARKAAAAGLAKAEYAMGYFTEVGIGVAPNLDDAKRWYWRAAAQDFPKARERLEDLKRGGKNGRPRPRERISRSRIEKQQDGECSIM